MNDNAISAIQIMLRLEVRKVLDRLDAIEKKLDAKRPAPTRKRKVAARRRGRG